MINLYTWLEKYCFVELKISALKAKNQEALHVNIIKKKNRTHTVIEKVN